MNGISNTAINGISNAAKVKATNKEGLSVGHEDLTMRCNVRKHHEETEQQVMLDNHCSPSVDRTGVTTCSKELTSDE